MNVFLSLEHFSVVQSSQAFGFYSEVFSVACKFLVKADIKVDVLNQLDRALSCRRNELDMLRRNR